MKLTILTPEKELYGGEVTSVKVPGKTGQFEILKGHSAIVSALGSGIVRIIAQNGERSEITISKGFVEVLRDEVSLLVQVKK